MMTKDQIMQLPSHQRKGLLKKLKRRKKDMAKIRPKGEQIVRKKKLTKRERRQRRKNK